MAVSFSSTTFNIGTGAYYYTDKFYVGVSTPRVLNTELKNNGITLSNSYTKKHFFLASGYVYTINSIVDLKSSFLLKTTRSP